MFVAFDRLVTRLRAARPTDDRGASLVLVIALMAVGFIVSALVASACLFALQQTTNARGNVQSFAAAEAGRDAVVAAMTASAANCNPTNPRFTGTDPGYEVTVYATDSLTQPTGIAGLTASCPTNASTFVVMRAVGTAAIGGTTAIESVYTWESFRERVAGGGLGFMDAAYSAYAVRYSGDIIVRHGDFTCAAGTQVDGSVYVLEGKVIVPRLLGFIGTSCSVTGDVVSGLGIDVQDGLLPSSQLAIGGNILTSGNITANDPIDAGGDVEVGGNINVASSGRLTTRGGAVKPDSSVAVGNISVAGSITANGRLETTTGSIATNTTITSSSTLRAASNVVALQGITASGGTIEATAGSVTSGTTINANGSSTIRGAGISAVGNITAGGTVQATTGSVRSGGGISGGTVTAGAMIEAVGNITGGTIQAAAGPIRSGGSISGTSVNVTTAGDVQAVTSITTATGTIRSTAGNIQSNGAITVTGTGTLDAVATNKGIAAGGLIDTRGPLKAFNVSAVGTLTTSSSCTIGGSVLAGGILTFAQPLANDSTSNKCQIQGAVRSAATGVSVLPVPGSGNNNRSQVYVLGAVEARGTWKPNGVYRKLTGNANTAGTPGKTVTAPTSPAVTPPSAPAAPATYTFTPADYPELYLRTQWVDLGKHTVWNGYSDSYALSTSECSSARTKVTSLLQTAGAPIVIDATACNSITLTGWVSVNLRRDAVLLVNNIQMQLIRFNQTGATTENPRQLFIVQADDDLTMASPASDPSGEPEPQPSCGGRSKMNTWGSGWGGLAAWDPLVRVLLYSPCGSTNTSALSEWRGHLYVANDSATTDIIGSVTCAHMWVEGTFDLPCSVNDFGEWSGVHTVNGKRMGTRAYQTEP